MTTFKVFKRSICALSLTLGVSVIASDAFACSQYFTYSVGRYQKISGRVSAFYTDLANTSNRSICMDTTEVVDRSGATQQDTCGCIGVPSDAANAAVVGKLIIFRSPGSLTVRE